MFPKHVLPEFNCWYCLTTKCRCRSNSIQCIGKSTQEETRRHGTNTKPSGLSQLHHVTAHAHALSWHRENPHSAKEWVSKVNDAFKANQGRWHPFQKSEHLLLGDLQGLKQVRKLERKRGTGRQRVRQEDRKVPLLGSWPCSGLLASWNSAVISRLLSIWDQQRRSGFMAAPVPQSSQDPWLTAISISAASLGKQSEGQDSRRFGLSFLIIQMIFTDKTFPIHQGSTLP